MPTTACRNCENQRVYTTIIDVVRGQAVYRFECGECGHEWAELVL